MSALTKPTRRRRLRARTTAIVNTPARIRSEYARFQDWRRRGCPRCGYRPPDEGGGQA